MSMVTPAAQQLIILVFWSVFLLVSAFLLRQACSLCGAELPSYRRAFVVLLFVAPAAYLVFDLTAYGCMLSMDDITLRVPQGYSYAQWLWEPLALKWQILGFVPGVRFVPIVLGLVTAGVLQVFFLHVSFGAGIVISVIHWVANVIALALLSFVTSLVLLALVPVARNSDSHGKAQQSSRADSEGQDHSLRSFSSLELGDREAPQDKLSSFQRKAKENLISLRDRVDPYLEPVKEELAPFTDRLPKPCVDFLNAGGWWLIFLVMGLITVFYVTSLYRRVRRVGFRSRKRRRKRTLHSPMDEDLSSLAVSFTDPSERVVTVKGLAARLRLVVMAPAGKDVGELHEGMLESLLDWIKPGLGQIAASDQPRTRIWPMQYSATGFHQAFQQHVCIPEPKGEQSQWVLLAGAVLLGRQKINVGMALRTNEPNKIRMITVQAEQWLDHLGIESARVRA
jgi:hypothetical protein